MSIIQTTIVDGHVRVRVPAELADGTQVEVRIVPALQQIGMNESEWRTDGDAIEEWCNWLTTIEPVDFEPPCEFSARFRQFNVDAVRRQMFGDPQ